MWRGKPLFESIFLMLGMEALLDSVHDYSLQKFKLNLANTVISQENSSLLSMNTSDLLDLFQLSDTPGEVARGGEKVRVLNAYHPYTY